MTIKLTSLVCFEEAGRTSKRNSKMVVILKMKKIFYVLCIATEFLCCSLVAHAEVVGQSLMQTDVFKQYVNERKTLEDKISITNSNIESQKKELAGEAVNMLERLGPSLYNGNLGNEVINILKEYALVFLGGETVIYIAMAISLLVSILYIVYLKKYHPNRWILSTSFRTFSFLKKKILRQNGVLPLLVIALLLGSATTAKAKTNVLQDMNMYYTGNQFEKGYLLCKYSKEPFTLDYTAVNNTPVIKQPGPGFERAYDMIAHLIGLHLSASAGEFAWLYDRADNEAQRRMVFELLVQLPKDAVQAAAEKVIDSICDQGRRQVMVSIDRFKMLLAALAGSDNRLFANGLVKTFLAKAVSQIRDLEGLDALVGLAVANDAFETLREPTAKVLKTIPSRLSFSDTVYAARVYFRIDKDMSRKLFNDIRFDFRKFMEQPILTQKLVELMQELSGVAAFRPIYDTDSLYKSLQQLPNSLRVQITSLLDSVDTALAGVAYNSIGHDAGDLVFRDSTVLRLFAELTAKYNKNGNGDIVNALARAVVESNVPYIKGDVLEAAGLMGEKPEAFAESVFTYDMGTDFKYNRNDKLFLSLVTVLTPQQIKAFEDYFAKKTSLANGLLIVLFQKDKPAFYKLLGHVFANAPQSIADLRLPNESFDLHGVATAFSAQALKGFETIPAPVLFAQHELAGPEPDVKLVRRALIPELDRLFRDFLTNEPKSLTEEQAIETLILLSIVGEPGGAAFKEEHFVLNKLAQDYFSGVVANGTAMLRQAVAEREEALSVLQKAVSLKKSVKRLEIVSTIYSGMIALYLFFGAALSLLYACNVLLPGKNLSLVNGILHWAESFACYLMATLIVLVPGFFLKVGTQFLRGLLATETMTPSLEECVAALGTQSPVLEEKTETA